jgi:hypothetical protein
MAGEDPDYIGRVKALPCAVDGCRSPWQDAHHPTGAGMALRSSDLYAIPLCHAHHMAFHSLSGPFKGWTKAKIREWQLERSEETRRILHSWIEGLPF